MNFLHGNDKKSIKSTLNDNKRNGVKLTIEEVIFGGTNSFSKMVQQMIKSVLKSVYMIRNDKSYCHLLSFSLFGAVNFCRFLSFFRPCSVPRRKIYPSKFNYKHFIINALQNQLVTFCVEKTKGHFACCTLHVAFQKSELRTKRGDFTFILYILYIIYIL